MQDTHLIYEENNAIGRIIINRPAARNALTLAMYGELKRYCGQISEKQNIRALIIQGAGGKAFAAGTDMTEFRSFSSPEDAWNYEQNMDEILGALEALKIPTIAALHGACTGGGGAIAAACDIRLASKTLKFGFPIARTLGNCLSANNLARLADIVGTARVREMLFTSRLIEADEAFAIGLVQEVFADEDALLSGAISLAERLASHAPLTLYATKEALRRLRTAQTVDDKDLISLCYTSEDFKNGMEAFLNKRPMNWKGR